LTQCAYSALAAKRSLNSLYPVPHGHFGLIEAAGEALGAAVVSRTRVVAARFHAISTRLLAPSTASILALVDKQPVAFSALAKIADPRRGEKLGPVVDDRPERGEVQAAFFAGRPIRGAVSIPYGDPRRAPPSTTTPTSPATASAARSRAAPRGATSRATTSASARGTYA
jgi:hypothetical protein